MRNAVFSKKEVTSGQICLLRTQFCPISPLPSAFNDVNCWREVLSFPRRRSPWGKSASSGQSFAPFLPSRQHSTTSIVDEKCCLYQEGGRLGPNLTPLDPVWPHFSPSVSIQRHHLAGFMKTVPSDSWSPHIVKGLCQGSPIHFVLFCQLLALNRYGT